MQRDAWSRQQAPTNHYRLWKRVKDGTELCCAVPLFGSESISNAFRCHHTIALVICTTAQNVYLHIHNNKKLRKICTMDNRPLSPHSNRLKQLMLSLSLSQQLEMGLPY
jgi:hypothetical protein